MDARRVPPGQQVPKYNISRKQNITFAIFSAEIPPSPSCFGRNRLLSYEEEHFSSSVYLDQLVMLKVFT